MNVLDNTPISVESPHNLRIDSNLESCFDSFLDSCKARNLAPGTLDFYNLKVSNFICYCHSQAVCDISQIDTTLINQYLNWLMESNSRFPPLRIALPFLAMTHHGLGQTDQADATLTDAAAALDEWSSTLQESGIAQLPIPWFDYLECLILYREAHQLIRQSAPPPDARLTLLEQDALATLRGE